MGAPTHIHPWEHGASNCNALVLEGEKSHERERGTEPSGQSAELLACPPERLDGFQGYFEISPGWMGRMLFFMVSSSV